MAAKLNIEILIKMLNERVEMSFSSQVKEELKNIEIALITEEITTIHETYTDLKNEIEAINSRLLDEESSSSDDATHLETLKLKTLRLEETISQENQKVLEVTSRFIGLQNEKMMYTERKKFAGNASDVENNIVRLKEEILELDKGINLLENENKHLEESIKREEEYLRNTNENVSFLKIKRSSLQNKFQIGVRELYELKSKKEIL